MSRRVALAPGRVRVRDHAWRDAATLEALAGRARAIRGVTSARGNTLTLSFSGGSAGTITQQWNR